MDDELNVTYITLGGYVEVHKYRYVYFVMLLIVYILITCSNSTIVYLIVIHQNLHEPMYIFIAALLINSVLFTTTVYPKLLIDILSEKQITTYSACLFQYYIFYSFGVSEFFLLAVMSYDRYVSICKPLQYPTIMSRTTISIFLVLAWLLPAIPLTVSTVWVANTKICRYKLNGIFCNNRIYELQCVVTSAQFIKDMLVLLNVALLPVIFVLFTYSRIFIITYRSSREVRRKAAQTCLPHLIVLINFICLSTFNVITGQLKYDFPKTVHLIMALQLILYHPLFNPIMYGLKMKEICKHLKRLFCSVKMN